MGSIHGPNIPGSYAILLFTTLDLASITNFIHNWVLFLLWLHLFFLELFLYSSPVAYWVPTNLGSSSFRVLSFCFFLLFIGFSRQEYWSGLPFPSPVDHVLSELSTMTPPSWVALHGMAPSFTELDKAMVHVIRLVSFLWLWSVSVLWWRTRGLWKLPDGRDWLRVKLGHKEKSYSNIVLTLLQSWIWKSIY